LKKLSLQEYNDLNIKISDAETLERNFDWDFNNYNFTYSLAAPKELYDFYSSLERPPTSDYSVYVTHELDDEYISNLVEIFEEVAQEKGFTKNELVSFIVAFIQNMEYTPDDVSKGYDEYPKYPLETLIDRGGDCEDTSILTAAMLNELGYGVVLLALPGHMAVGVLGSNGLNGSYYEYQDERYYYLETTNTGWNIGVIPPEYKDKEARILPLRAKPLITHSWATQNSQAGYLGINVTVKNEGTATAYNTKVYTAFDAGNNMVYDEELSETFILEPGITGTCELRLKYPVGVTTRIITKILVGDEIWDESTSEWFDI